MSQETDLRRYNEGFVTGPITSAVTNIDINYEIINFNFLTKIPQLMFYSLVQGLVFLNHCDGSLLSPLVINWCEKLLIFIFIFYEFLVTHTNLE